MHNLNKIQMRMHKIRTSNQHSSNNMKSSKAKIIKLNKFSTPIIFYLQLDAHQIMWQLKIT